MQNCQLNGLLMDYKTNYNFISKRGHNSEILHNWKAYIICYVLHNFDDLFSFNLLSWELLIVCGWISSISHCFCDKLNQKRPKVAISVIKSTKDYAKFQKKPICLHPSWNGFLRITCKRKVGSWVWYVKCILWISSLFR